MEPNLKVLVSVVMGLGITSIGCGPAKGACTIGDGPTATCGDFFTSGTCNPSLNGRFSEGMTCEDLGFRATNDSENLIVDGVTGVS